MSTFKERMSLRHLSIEDNVKRLRENVEGWKKEHEKSQNSLESSRRWSRTWKKKAQLQREAIHRLEHRESGLRFEVEDWKHKHAVELEKWRKEKHERDCAGLKEMAQNKRIVEIETQLEEAKKSRDSWQGRSAWQASKIGALESRLKKAESERDEAIAARDTTASNYNAQIEGLRQRLESHKNAMLRAQIAVGRLEKERDEAIAERGSVKAFVSYDKPHLTSFLRDQLIKLLGRLDSPEVRFWANSKPTLQEVYESVFSLGLVAVQEKLDEHEKETKIEVEEP